MKILSSIGEKMNGAVDFVVEKNKKLSKSSRLKKCIKKETNAMIRAFVQLGKNYYKDLRDVPNADMQRLCREIDRGKAELKRLQDQLSRMDTEEESLLEFADEVQDECFCDYDGCEGCGAENETFEKPSTDDNSKEN